MARGSVLRQVDLAVVILACILGMLGQSSSAKAQTLQIYAFQAVMTPDVSTIGLYSSMLEKRGGCGGLICTGSLRASTVARRTSQHEEVLADGPAGSEVASITDKIDDPAASRIAGFVAHRPGDASELLDNADAVASEFVKSIPVPPTLWLFLSCLGVLSLLSWGRLPALPIPDGIPGP